jgi:hypothetical protein
MKKYLDIPNNGTHRVFCATTKRNIDKKQINAYVKPYILFLQKKKNACMEEELTRHQRVDWMHNMYKHELGMWINISLILVGVKLSGGLFLLLREATTRESV